MPAARRRRPTSPMTLAEVTEFPGKSRITIWRMRRDGRFPDPVSRRGNSLVWDGTAVRRWRLTGGQA